MWYFMPVGKSSDPLVCLSGNSSVPSLCRWVFCFGPCVWSQACRRRRACCRRRACRRRQVALFLLICQGVAEDKKKFPFYWKLLSSVFNPICGKLARQMFAFFRPAFDYHLFLFVLELALAPSTLYTLVCCMRLCFVQVYACFS